jgi:hypothetical protein
MRGRRGPRGRSGTRRARGTGNACAVSRPIAESAARVPGNGGPARARPFARIRRPRQGTDRCRARPRGRCPVCATAAPCLEARKTAPSRTTRPRGYRSRQVAAIPRRGASSGPPLPRRQAPLDELRRSRQARPGRRFGATSVGPASPRPGRSRPTVSSSVPRIPAGDAAAGRSCAVRGRGNRATPIGAPITGPGVRANLACRERRERNVRRKRKNPGDDLFSRKAALSVSSALESLTSVFGMGTGMASPPMSPGFSASGWLFGCDRAGPEGRRGARKFSIFEIGVIMDRSRSQPLTPGQLLKRSSPRPLVPLSFIRHRTSTCGLSNRWSPCGLTRLTRWGTSSRGELRT